MRAVYIYMMHAHDKRALRDDFSHHITTLASCPTTRTTSFQTRRSREIYPCHLLILCLH